jgi:hypothetical protein
MSSVSGDNHVESDNKKVATVNQPELSDSNSLESREHQDTAACSPSMVPVNTDTEFYGDLERTDLDTPYQDTERPHGSQIDISASPERSLSIPDDTPSVQVGEIKTHIDGILKCCTERARVLSRQQCPSSS